VVSSRAVAELDGAGLEVLEHQAPEPASLKARMHPHPFQLGHRVRDMSQRTHGDEPSVEHADEELATVLEIGGTDRTQVLVLGPVAPRARQPR
jgi:hypothetical protein